MAAIAVVTNSMPRLPAPVQLLPLETRSREEVAAVIESLIGTNWRVSHHLNPQKDAHLMASVPIYVWQRQGRNRAGLLLLRAGQPAVYWNTEKDEPVSLKLQVPATLTHKGPVLLVATLSRLERLLIIEDIWANEGRNLLGAEPYSARWSALQVVYNGLNKQQYFLGADLRLVEPISFERFLSLCDENPDEGTVWEFQPDIPGRRRLVWMIPGRGGIRSAIPVLRKQESQLKTAARLGLGDDAIAQELLTSMDLKRSEAQVPQHKAKLKPTTQPQPKIHTTKFAQQRCALLRRDTVTALPDSYILWADEGAELGRICVPRLAQSQELRKAFMTTDGLYVDVKWNTNFEKYEVSQVLPAGTPLSPADAFSANV
jgi:hypothetical protein